MTTGSRTRGRKTKKNELRRAYREKVEAQIQEVAARLDLWEAKAKKARADARIRYLDEIAELRGKLETARLKLSLLRNASEAAREDVREGVETAVRDLRRSLERASSRFE